MWKGKGEGVRMEWEEVRKERGEGYLEKKGEEEVI